MDEGSEPHGSRLTAAALIGSVMAIFLIPAALAAVPLLGSGGLVFWTLLSFMALTLLLVLAVAGLSLEVEDLRAALRRTPDAARTSQPTEHEPRRD